MSPSAVIADLHPPLSPAAKEALVRALDFLNEMVRELERKDKRTQLPWYRDPTPLTEEQAHALIAQVSVAAEGNTVQMLQVEFRKWLDTLAKALKPWLAHPDVRLAHLVKLLYGLGMLGEAEGKRPDFYGDARELINAYGRTPGRASLLELRQLLDACGLPGRRLLVEDWFHRHRRSIAKGWANEAIGPFFAADQSFLEHALNPLGPHANFYTTFREGVFDALCTLAQLPGDLQGPLFQLALGSAKADRVGAQRVLDQLPGKEARIIEALSSGKAENRTAAAQWIARLKIGEATPALEAALKKEKNDGTAGALMSALEILGVPASLRGAVYAAVMALRRLGSLPESTSDCPILLSAARVARGMAWEGRRLPSARGRYACRS